jgi:hypothetical protein
MMQPGLPNPAGTVGMAGPGVMGGYLMQPPAAAIQPAGGIAAPAQGVVTGPAVGQPNASQPTASAPSPANTKATGQEQAPVAGCETPLVIDGDEDHHPACEPSHGCGNGRIWVEAEYLLWWIKNGSVPVTLVTTGTPASLGILGRQGTLPLFQDSNFAYGYGSGGRLTAGFWFNDCQSVGFEANGFVIEHLRDSFRVASAPNGLPLLASPFINSLNGLESASFISRPGQNTGAFLASTGSQTWGAEADFVVGLCHCGPARSDLLLGFRYLDLSETLDIDRTTSLFPNVTVPFGGGFITAPQTIGINDSFDTQNRFYGCTIGYRYEHSWDCFCLSLMAKGSLGTTQQVIEIQGVSRATAGNGAVTEVPGGLLALSGANIGRVTKYRFTGVPEGEFKIGYHVTKNILLSLGYNFIYWSSVVRPAEQISRTINPTLLPTSVNFGTNFGGPQPILPLHQTDFWVQGISAGIAIVY